MAYTTREELDNVLPTVIEKARFTSQFVAVMAGMCWNITKQLHSGKTVNVPYFGEAAASNLTEGVDMASSETMEDTNVQITPGEVGCKIVLTDTLVRDAQEDINSAAGKILGNAMEKKRDEDLLEQIDDATTSLGSTSTTLTMGAIAAARALLAGNASSSGGPAPLPYVCVHHPFTLLDLVDVVTPIVPTATYLNVTGTAFTDDIIKNYTIGRLFGMPILEDGNLDIATSTSGKGGVFAAGEGGGIILATANEWSVEPERDASLRGWELNVVSEYGVGEYLAGWIVELLMDATTPA